MSTVREILREKGNTIWSVSPETTLAEVLKIMAERNIGAVLVLENSQIAGIFSERDFVKNSANERLEPEFIRIAEIMTNKVFFVNPSNTTEECMSLMTQKRIRHLPVFENDELLGIISIGDVVNKIIEEQKFSIAQLEKYVSGSTL